MRPRHEAGQGLTLPIESRNPMCFDFLGAWMQFKHPRTRSAWDKCWESSHDRASVYPKPLLIVIHNVIGNVMYNTGLSQFTPPSHSCQYATVWC